MMVDILQRGISDRAHGRALVDGEIDDSRVALADPPVPLLASLQRPGSQAREERARDLEIVDPPLIQRQQLAVERPQGHLVATDADDAPIGIDWRRFHRSSFRFAFDTARAPGAARTPPGMQRHGQQKARSGQARRVCLRQSASGKRSSRGARASRDAGGRDADCAPYVRARSSSSVPSFLSPRGGVGRCTRSTVGPERATGPHCRQPRRYCQQSS